MKNNFVAKHAQKTGSGFHTEEFKPEQDDSFLTVLCRTCGQYSDIDENEYQCPQCDSKNVVEVGGLS